MASQEQNSCEGFISSYKINIRILQSKLTIGAEHCQTKKVYRTEMDQDDVNNITQNICETCQHLFELLHELIENDGICSNKSLKLIEQETKLLLNVTLTVGFGRVSRQFNMEFQLESVQLDDITRLENIINEHTRRLEQLEWNANDRFDHATKLTSIWENEFKFQNLSPTDHVYLSDNDCTIRCQTHNNQERAIQDTQAYFGSSFGVRRMPTTEFTTETFSKEAIVITNQSFFPSNNKRYQSIRFNLHLSRSLKSDKILIGIVYQPNNKQWSNIESSDDTWLLNVGSGSIQHSNFSPRQYTWPIRPISLSSNGNANRTSHVDVLFDIHSRCLAFRIDDQTEDQWAFYLPKNLRIDQLYPIVILNSSTVSISIDI
ncbi:unnamed protein product [Rotaria sp. Silwood1]|nr:unnamed protein product [Rotaria sp. Silwood1]